MALSAKHTFSNYRRCPRALYVKHILLPLCVYSIYNTHVYERSYMVYIYIFCGLFLYTHIYVRANLVPCICYIACICFATH